MAVADFVGRKYDLLTAQVDLSTDRSGFVDFSFLDQLGRSRICAGIQKLAQAWLIRFLTIPGSRPFDPDFGCSFLRQIRLNQLHTELDVQLAFSLAAADIQLQLAATTADLPLDEQLAVADLTALSVTNGQISLSVTLTSQAGASITVLAPIDVLPAPLAE